MPGGGVVVAELACERCGARTYSALALPRPDLIADCAACGGRCAVVRHIEDRRRQDVAVADERRAQSA